MYGTTIIFTDTDKALIDALKALSLFANESYNMGYGWPTVIGETDPQGLQQARDAIAGIEAALSPQVLATTLPAYTKVAFTVNGSTIEGQIRDGAWGLHRDNRTSIEARRVTTTMGFEVWLGQESEITDFKITERAS